MDVELTEAGLADPLFSGLAAMQKCLQWHSVRVAQPPEGAVVLAWSPACPVQAMRVGPNAWSMQYHVEVEPDTVTNWAAVPAYRDALVNVMGEGGMGTLSQGAAENVTGFLASAERLYDNFMRLARV
jgi:GMP synthase-like glutamine amidotransferase